MISLNTHCTTKSVNKTMDYNPPTDKFVMVVNMPEFIWAFYIVFVLPLYLMVAENVTNIVDPTKRPKNAMIS